ncbi:iron-sulfur cluster assembly scaffold protein [Palleronia caenipelagi]|uniref:Iron-sulfur cluster assembly scaffold protein n=1 Tax=Palleronia caenipelagi TaxID=2489174 RepID=A0A547Q622_9RHOB|nr:iron-sulfur cluster assembly scaffold protein [Palleronia caenipelagi]TRD21835.1 iron-sulfur cluster assembly scaffold protein [Palleronia caenipelagi]
MAETDLIKLYSGRILELAAAIPHHGSLDAPQASVRKRSPLCGSTVTVEMDLTGGQVSRYAHDVKACALGQASASIFGAHVIGLTGAEIAALRDQVKAMLIEDGPVPPAPFNDYEVLVPARAYKNRHASILLVLDAAVDAVAEAEANTPA